MYKALKAVQRTFVRAPLKQFVLNQKQFRAKSIVSNRDVAMQHDIKKGPK